jgi:hypothetical protein
MRLVNALCRFVEVAELQVEGTPSCMRAAEL